MQTEGTASTSRTPEPGRPQMSDHTTLLQPQFSNGQWIFLLDGRVVEWFYDAVSEGKRLHVDHLRMEAVPHGDGLRIRWGVDVNGKIVNGGRMDVPVGNVTAFHDFIALALANRTVAERLD